MFPEAVQDKPTVTADWLPATPLIDGVEIREVRNIVTANSVSTELFRDDWGLGIAEARHILNVCLHPRAITAWHMHLVRTDSIFVIRGTVKLVLYDDRDDAASKGRINAFNLSIVRPRLVIIPTGVWHGLQNMTDEDAIFVNCADVAYQYDDPDEWRVPQGYSGIPYRFAR